jgi:hypothetical protein
VWIRLLSERGITAYPEFSDVTKATPYIDVQLADVMPTSHRKAFADGAMLVDAWTGSLKCTVCTLRGKNSNKQTPYLGAIRVTAAKYRSEFPRHLLPWHSVQLLKEGGLRRGVDQENDIDWSELRLDLHFGVRPEAWPLVLP